MYVYRCNVLLLLYCNCIGHLQVLHFINLRRAVCGAAPTGERGIATYQLQWYSRLDFLFACSMDGVSYQVHPAELVLHCSSTVSTRSRVFYDSWIGNDHHGHLAIICCVRWFFCGVIFMWLGFCHKEAYYIRCV